jgi:signal transduction histidine kinase
LIIIVFGIYINRFFRGLGKLSGTVDRLARGEYQARLEMNPDSEFALLAQSFNQIAETMESRIQDREKHVKIMAQMAGGVAHEIRNPLGGIKGFAELLMSETPTSDPRHKYVSYILKEVNSLEALVQNVLDFARPKTPSYSLTLLEEILESLMPPLQQKISFLKSEGTKITLFMHHDPAIQTIEADAGQIRQLLLNLALNACDAMEDAGGNLEIIIRAFSAGDIPDFNTAHPEQYITLLVSDTGEGMDEETLEQLFTPFFTTKSSGTGLGLAISKKIVEIHNGKMHISSIQGKGTNFKIVLPRASIVKESYT